MHIRKQCMQMQLSNLYHIFQIQVQEQLMLAIFCRRLLFYLKKNIQKNFQAIILLCICIIYLNCTKFPLKLNQLINQLYQTNNLQFQGTRFDCNCSFFISKKILQKISALPTISNFQHPTKSNYNINASLVCQVLFGKYQFKRKYRKIQCRMYCQHRNRLGAPQYELHPQQNNIKYIQNKLSLVASILLLLTQTQTITICQLQLRTIIVKVHKQLQENVNEI
eukprot:TRINITY_DN7467_c1_g1_i5.p3 TRINITY_DN7467_c1_g1~~TRINITY_DN7467_c1_g1_i5.p3  ORF type:complete len:222 (-),score=-13.11 TRINITY_DN7467_c1_g1_i5:145-810(-)